MLFVSLFIRLLPAPICEVLYWSRYVSGIIILLLIIILKCGEVEMGNRVQEGTIKEVSCQVIGCEGKKRKEWLLYTPTHTKAY
jgi:hypothetical protein